MKTSVLRRYIRLIVEQHDGTSGEHSGVKLQGPFKKRQKTIKNVKTIYRKFPLQVQPEFTDVMDGWDDFLQSDALENNGVVDIEHEIEIDVDDVDPTDYSVVAIDGVLITQLDADVVKAAAGELTSSEIDELDYDRHLDRSEVNSDEDTSYDWDR